MTLVRNTSHDRNHPAKSRRAKTLGFLVSALAGAFVVIWGLGWLEPHQLLEPHDPGLPNTTRTQLAPGDAETIYDRYDDCIVSAAAICTS